ncbi:hypothetical protein [Nocardia sp. NPDC046763]|uniref:phage major capsid protein n=1 Tax=Nocardia sp. NPDC046763 TaxID=3155256 RepID=UPI0033CF338D
MRKLRTLAQQRFIADYLLSGRYEVSGGAIVYEQTESIYSDRPPAPVAPGSAYSETTTGTGPAQMANTAKWGEDTLITDEAIKRRRMDPVQRAMIKVVNQMVKTVDGNALSVIASQVTQTSVATGGAGSGNWANSSTATIFRDCMVAKAKVRKLNQGYELDTLAVDDVTWANIISDPAIALLLRRESPASPIYTGDLPEIGQLRVLPTPNIPTPGTAILVDHSLLGGMADEEIGGPGYVRAQDGIPGLEAKIMREDKEDQWRLRCRRSTVPIVIEPNAAWVITGV